jgi:uncharacterized LabA/DUF88 family protein
MAYVDGFSLYHSIKGSHWDRYLWLDVDALARLLSRPEGQVIGVKYFTSIVFPTPDDPDKRNRQGRYLAALRSSTTTRIILGSYKRRQSQCHRCGATWQSFQEKQTDINIAIEILEDAYEDRFDTLLLISRDGDLVSILRTISSRFPEKRIILAYPPGRASPDLPRFADAFIHVTDAHFRACQLPDQVTTQTGRTVERPPTWR